MLGTKSAFSLQYLHYISGVVSNSNSHCKLSSYYQTYNRRSQWKYNVVLHQFEMCYMVIPYYFKLFIGKIHNKFTSRWLYTCLPAPYLDIKQYVRYSKQRLWSLLVPCSFVWRHFGGTCCLYILHFYPENGDSTYPLNVGTYQPNYMESHLFPPCNCLSHCVQIFSAHV